MTDDDDLADKYLLAEERLSAAGLSAYEVSNWSTGPATRCRHNLAYWRSDHWWGIGPGAHSHVGGVRWWNVKHPAAYAARIADGFPRRTPARCSGRGAAGGAGAAGAPAGRGTGRRSADRE